MSSFNSSLKVSSQMPNWHYFNSGLPLCYLRVNGSIIKWSPNLIMGIVMLLWSWKCYLQSLQCNSWYKACIPVKRQLGSPSQLLHPFLIQSPSGDRKTLQESRAQFCWRDTWTQVQVKPVRERKSPISLPRGMSHGRWEEVGLPTLESYKCCFSMAPGTAPRAE